MRRYQAVLVLKPDIESAAVEDFRKKFEKLLKDGEAVNIEMLEDNMRDLSHAIKKQPRAHFWRLSFESESGLVSKLREEIRHDERLLRQIYLHGVSDASLSDTSFKGFNDDDEDWDEVIELEKNQGRSSRKEKGV